MSENLFNAVLTFSLLVGGTAALGSEMFTARPADKAQATTVAQGMARGKAASQAPVTVLPPVTITFGRMAMASSPSDAPRVQ